MNSDCIMSFSSTGDGSGRGGRHVEFGIAVAQGMYLIVVGRRENVFHHLPDVRQFDDLPSALEGLNSL